MPGNGPRGAAAMAGAAPGTPPGELPGAAPGGERFGRERRVRSSRDFARVRRAGRSVSGARLTLAYVARAAAIEAGLEVNPETNPEAKPKAGHAQPTGPARVGFIVGKRVGGAVVRNRVRRRLREIMRRKLRSIQPGWDLVIIARPPAAAAPSAELARELGALLRRARVLTPEDASRAGYEGAE